MNKKTKTLKEYIEQLFEEVEGLFEKSKRYHKLEFMSMLTLIITVIFFNSIFIVLAAWNLWFVLFVIRGIYIDRPLNKKFGEIDGCFRTLRLLGLLDDEPPRGKKESKKSLMERLKETWGKVNWRPQLQPQLQN